MPAGRPGKASTPAPLPEGLTDPYKELELEACASSELVTKSYRSLAKKYHPDRNRNKPKEIQEKNEAIFLRIKAAYEYLDDSARKESYDAEKQRKLAAVRARDQREGQMDARRRARKRELEEEERRAAAQTATAGAPEPSSLPRKRPATDRNLQKEGKERREAMASERRRREAAAATESRVKVKWVRAKHSHSDETLVALFRPFGHVRAVEFVGEKGNSAFVTLDSPAAALAAQRAFASHDSMKVTSLNSAHARMSTAPTGVDGGEPHESATTRRTSPPVPDDLHTILKGPESSILGRLSAQELEAKEAKVFGLLARVVASTSA
uniref:J domain-containing protein n=1 Tax=Rhizochromulina marina TaxID=1034831 RepID=A0A7S2W3U8_9STRA|mmetsp:Transcript_13337/g.38783  ORF Transcript_13337/g.38783 Transcript_13337/m.38783 type:complete len:324 (+) Transcript_13337:37-1008(+)